MNKTAAEKLIAFIDKSPSVYHVVHNALDFLQENGFVYLKRDEPFDLQSGKKYVVTNNGSALIAWQMCTDNLALSSAKGGFKIIGSHSDSPTFRIKPNPEITVNEHYLKLNTEVYGGAILSTWFDRPLCAAGRALLKSADPLQPHVCLVDFNKELLVIPNLAIHMNREVNENCSYNKQKDTLPILSLINENTGKNGFLLKHIARTLDVAESEIIDFDLYLYDRQPGCFVGLNDEFFSVGKIDNLGMAYASLDALVHTPPSQSYVQLAAVFDNEEVGSATKQGAASPFLYETLQRIVLQSCAKNPFETLQMLFEHSFLISADQAHALHPNYTEKNDITNFPLINKGPVIKHAASMSYTSDGLSAAVFKSICEKAHVPCQTFVNRSDMRGGSTIGPISSSHVNIKSVDVGNPILAMHSVRELGGTQDQEYITKAFSQFYADF